jgi:Tfp pilus assembly protein PilF
MRSRFVLAVLVHIVLTAFGGCSTWEMSAPKYRTVVANPHRDETLAREKNCEAAKALDQNNLTKAEQLLQDALAADVDYGPAHNNLGMIYYQQGRFYLAAWEFEYAIQTMGPHPEPFNNLGLVLEAVDKLDEAIKNYGSAHELDPKNPEYLGNLARAKLKRDAHDAEARSMLHELITYETRPEWRDWASEFLATDKDGPSGVEVIETVPAPIPKAPLPVPSKLIFPRDEIELPEPGS